MKHLTRSIAAAAILMASAATIAPASAAPIIYPPKLAAVVTAHAPEIIVVGGIGLVACLIHELATPGDNYNGFCSPGKQVVPYVKAEAPFVDQAALASGRLDVMTQNQLLYRPGYNESRK